MSGRVWVDVEDMFIYASSGSTRPTGIQRLSFELCRALHDRYGASGHVQFVRQDLIRGSFATVPFASLERLFNDLTEPSPVMVASAPLPVAAVRPLSGPRRVAKATAHRALYRLPVRVRQPLTRYTRLQVQALGAFAELSATAAGLIPGIGRRALRLIRRLMAQPPPPVEAPPALAVAPVELGYTDEGLDVRFSVDAAPGDVLAAIGSAWFHPDYPSLVRQAKVQHQLRFALLVYDIIPLRRPEWCDRAHVRSFKAWFDGMLPLCDAVFTISKASSGELREYARENRIALPSLVREIPIGTGFGSARITAQRDADPDAFARLPKPRSYALFVSTIEARKNHVLLFRVWRRMLEEMPREEVPTLVFAGRVGWLVADLMQQIENADYLDGKLVIIEHPTDAELEMLYRGCLFTLFPSLYEGWGLPVTESLAFGKPCVISDSTSLPEAGGSLARYFDPENLADAYRVIRETIEDRPGLHAWEAQVAREFRPVSWDETAQAMVEGLLARVAAE